MVHVSKPRSANHSIADECGRPGTCRSKVGCEAIEEPCTKRIVARGAPAAEGLCQRKSRTSPAAVFLVVQCSLPVMAVFYARIRPPIERGGLDGRRHRKAGHVSEAADAPRAGPRRAPGDPREGPRHLADLDVARIR